MCKTLYFIQDHHWDFKSFLKAKPNGEPKSELLQCHLSTIRHLQKLANRASLLSSCMPQTNICTYMHKNELLQCHLCAMPIIGWLQKLASKASLLSLCMPHTNMCTYTCAHTNPHTHSLSPTLSFVLACFSFPLRHFPMHLKSHYC